MVTDEQLKANSIYQYGYVEKYHIVDPGNQDPVEFGRLYDELGWEFVWEAHRRRDMIRFGLFTKKVGCHISLKEITVVFSYTRGCFNFKSKINSKSELFAKVIDFCSQLENI